MYHILYVVVAPVATIVFDSISFCRVNANKYFPRSPRFVLMHISHSLQDITLEMRLIHTETLADVFLFLESKCYVLISSAHNTTDTLTTTNC